MKTLLYILCSKKVKYAFVLIILLFIYVSICAFSYANAVSTSLEDNVFRLHVLANSDSEEDQNLKYKVRDALIEYMNSICKDVTSKQEAIYIASNNKDNFYKIAKDVISQNGYNYDVNVEIGNFSFPTKDYGDISLPSGYYDALRVKIGKAEGQNWWCVMFPPLCFVNVSSGIVPEESKNNLKENLSEEEFNIISSENTTQIKFKFKLIEFLNSANILTAKK